MTTLVKKLLLTFKNIKQDTLEKVFIVLLLVLTLFNISLMTSLPIKGELDFNTDVARDFLLFREIDEKKIILIGPRTSSAGIFHGPAWLYLTYPGYLLGKGNPVVVEWYWISLTVAFIGTSFLVTRKIIGTLPGVVYATFLSANLVLHTKSMLNPHGALFLMPFFIFTLLLYRRQLRFYWLAIHLMLGTLMFQFQMFVGAPMLIVSSLIILYTILTKRRLVHLAAFLVVPLFLTNYVLFDIRHDFGVLRSLFTAVTPTTSSGELYDFSSQILSRFGNFVNLQLSLGLTDQMQGIIFVLVAILSFQFIKSRDKNADLMRLLIIFYVGYIGLTFINKGVVLYHQIYPMLALTTLVFSLLFSTKYKKLLMAVALVILCLNTSYVKSTMDEYQTKILGKSQWSWTFLSTTAKEVARNAPQSFGYFVFSPDQVAYQPRYAMIHVFKSLGLEAHEYEKKPVTFVIAAPEPSDRPWLNYRPWLFEQVKIKNNPTSVETKSNGYRIFKFELAEKDRAIPIDRNLIIGLHYR